MSPPVTTPGGTRLAGIPLVFGRVAKKLNWLMITVMLEISTQCATSLHRLAEPVGQGKLETTMTTQTAGTPGTGNTPASGATSLTAPDLWAIRSDAQVNQGPVMFVQSKEVWISTPPR